MRHHQHDGLILHIAEKKQQNTNKHKQKWHFKQGTQYNPHPQTWIGGGGGVDCSLEYKGWPGETFYTGHKEH
jgi:hypothetical protein